MMIMSLTSHIFVIYDIMITEVKGKVKAIRVRRKFTNKKAGRALHSTSSSSAIRIIESALNSTVISLLIQMTALLNEAHHRN